VFAIAHHVFPRITPHWNPPAAPGASQPRFAVCLFSQSCSGSRRGQGGQLPGKSGLRQRAESEVCDGAGGEGCSKQCVRSWCGRRCRAVGRKNVPPQRRTVRRDWGGGRFCITQGRKRLWCTTTDCVPNPKDKNILPVRGSQTRTTPTHTETVPPKPLAERAIFTDPFRPSERNPPPEGHSAPVSRSTGPRTGPQRSVRCRRPGRRTAHAPPARRPPSTDREDVGGDGVGDRPRPTPTLRVTRTAGIPPTDVKRGVWKGVAAVPDHALSPGPEGPFSTRSFCTGHNQRPDGGATTRSRGRTPGGTHGGRRQRGDVDGCCPQPAPMARPLRGREGRSARTVRMGRHARLADRFLPMVRANAHPPDTGVQTHSSQTRTTQRTVSRPLVRSSAALSCSARSTWWPCRHT
jgi:hypothetical protein